jgi:hypothetical protein
MPRFLQSASDVTGDIVQVGRQPRPTRDRPTRDRLDLVREINQRHAKDCAFRMAATCPVELRCDHGHAVCPECDPCTCGAGIADQKLPKAARLELDMIDPADVGRWLGTTDPPRSNA